jgi:diadenosine tetraphosphate (Ap4A) HIT family hydrolase
VRATRIGDVGREERVAAPDPAIVAAVRGENPKVMTRMRSGFAVIGDTQHLPGYSLLLTDDLAVDHLTDLPWSRRRDFLFDLSLIGEAVFAATRERGARRINYEVLGNSISHLHGHVHVRYDWEPPDKIGGPVWRYPKDLRNAPKHAYDDARHGDLRAAITAELTRVMTEAYAALGITDFPAPS